MSADAAPTVTPSAHRNVFVCAGARAATGRPLPRSNREGKFERTGTALCAGKTAAPPNIEEETKQNGRRAILRGNRFYYSESNLDRP